MLSSFNAFKAITALVALAIPCAALNYNVSLNSQTRLAYYGDTGMTVSWNTYEYIANPTVLYGLDPNKLQFSASSAVSVTYNTSLTYNNHVQIENLLPDTVYYYIPTTLIRPEPEPQPFSFKTGLPAGIAKPFSVALVVDMGTFGPEGLGTSAGTGVSPNNILEPGEHTTIQSLVSELDSFEFLMHPGDIAYADAWLKEARTGYIQANISYAEGYKAYESILDGYYDQMTPITTRKPYMVGPGNHEANCDNGGSGPFGTEICMPGQMNFTGFINHFRMPSDRSGGFGNFWYSFDHGMVHFVQIDTETDLGHGLAGPDESNRGPVDSGSFGLMNQQIDWLTKDLVSVDRAKTPWVVVLGHRAWYASGSVCSTCRQAFESIFLKYKVDVYFAGHFHVFERNDPIGANGTADPNGLNNPSAPWYLINGAGGHYDGLDDFKLPLTSYHRFGLSTNDSVYGWSKFTFHNCTHLTHDFIASNNNSVLDSATLFKDRVCGATLPSLNLTSVSMTASVVYTTATSTITACPTTATACPKESTMVVTSTYALRTTTVPVSTPTPTAASASSTAPKPTSSAAALRANGHVYRLLSVVAAAAAGVWVGL